MVEVVSASASVKSVVFDFPNHRPQRTQSAPSRDTEGQEAEQDSAPPHCLKQLFLENPNQQTTKPTTDFTDTEKTRMPRVLRVRLPSVKSVVSEKNKPANLHNPVTQRIQGTPSRDTEGQGGEQDSAVPPCLKQLF